MLSIQVFTLPTYSGYGTYMPNTVIDITQYISMLIATGFLYSTNIQRVPTYVTNTVL